MPDRTTTLPTLAACLALIFLCSCVTTPKVEYGLATAADGGAPQFTLTGSRVAIGLSASPSDGKPAGKNTAGPRLAVNDASQTAKDVPELVKLKPMATVTPAETAPIYRITPKPPLFGDVALSVTYYDNTRLVKTIGAPVTDNTVKIIETVGGIVATLLPLFADVKAGETKNEELPIPTVLDFSDAATLTAALTDEGTDVPGVTGWRYRLANARFDDKARPTNEFFESSGTTPEFPFSACLTGTLQLWKGAGAPAQLHQQDVAQFPVTIADPTHVRSIALPAKGTITMHTICGADVKAENADLAKTLDIVEALAKQADAIYKAAKDKK